ncbi:sensor histidine kinase [Actinomadura montaniterrae]|uniref:histidine kinase n=1 Tax=Actinomadura montaniterrae TaxID=1803903 RepID=A0A6L3VJY7_9ACTN|nr:histidine kinase [Actinomadura montaniterrae]KAB2369538.1 sensor histidine kinase [Actinomadura montaniterrae]
MPDARTADRAVAAAVTAATVAPALWSARPWWVVALALLASVPVLWRRRAPLRVGLVVGLAMTALVVWQKPLLLPWGPLVAVYTIAALSRPLLRLLSVPLLAATVYVSIVLPGEDSDVYPLLGTAFTAAFALGMAEQARRAQAAEHAERTLRLEQERSAAAAGERARIARDMHDVLTHSVGLMVVQAEAAPLAGPDRAVEAFGRIADTGRGALTQLRAILDALRDDTAPGGAQPGLATLPDLVRGCGLPAALTVDGEPRQVAPDAAVAAYRIVQESLTNVRKHAGPVAAVTVAVRWRDVLEIEVADDGRGGEPAASGHGLTGMRERAAACGGTVRAGPGPRGFTVLARLPVE